MSPIFQEKCSELQKLHDLATFMKAMRRRFEHSSDQESYKATLDLEAQGRKLLMEISEDILGGVKL